MKNLLIFLLVFSLTCLHAQISHPRISPMAVTEQVIGLTHIKVEYSRPGVRGRHIIGELVPYGRIWRVGANESTKFSVDTPIHILGNTLAAGTYALYAFPSKERWEIAFHANTGHWGDGRDAYVPEEDLFRIQVVPEQLQELQENFLIAFDRLDHNGADMVWQWEHTRLTIPIEVDTEALMDREIALQLETNPSAQTYYEVARYLLEQKRDADMALIYVDKAIELGGDTYYYYRVKSELEASLKQYDRAVSSAMRSKELANALGKDEFVRMNQRNMDAWQKELQIGN